jgi:hypothetical protein
VKKIVGILALTILPSCSIASGSAIVLPESESQRLIANNLSMTTESFFKAYMSTDIEQRRLAEMYVIGVIDSSEGESWCGFDISSPDAIQEQVYIGLKRTLARSPKERASTAIKSQLKELLPCKEKQ